MYSIDKQEIEKQNKEIEVDIHPISKWKRILLYLGDMMISFILSVLLLTVAVMPIASLIAKPNRKEAHQMELRRDDILYDHQLLFYKSEDDASYPKYDFNANLVYSFNRWLAYYVFEDGDPALDPTNYPEYKHLPENEIIYHYYHDILGDDLTYKKMFQGHESNYLFFTYNDDFPTSNAILKTEYKNEVIPFFDPGDKMSSSGTKIYDALSDLYASLFGVVLKDIYNNPDHDLKDSTDTYSYRECQKYIEKVNRDYNLLIAISALIAYVLSWALVHILYPLINSSNRTPTMSVMQLDRLGINNLYPINKKEAAFTASYFLLFDMPFLMFLSLSYTSLIYTLSVPLLPFFSLLSLFVIIISLFVLIFNGFDRSLSDLLSHTVIVSTDEVDGIIKAKETIQELKAAERKKNEQ